MEKDSIARTGDGEQELEKVLGDASKGQSASQSKESVCAYTFTMYAAP